MPGASAFANTKWADLLEPNETVSLTEDLSLETSTGSTMKRIPISEGTAFQIDQVDGLDAIQVVLMTLTEVDCTKKNPENSEMSLVLPKETTPGGEAEVGVLLANSCTLSVFIEWKDLNQPSFFKR